LGMIWREKQNNAFVSGILLRQIMQLSSLAP
jgi:hypothetical protein